MKREKADILIRSELAQYDVEEASPCWRAVYNQMIDAHDVLSRKEFCAAIYELVELYPLAQKYSC